MIRWMERLAKRQPCLILGDGDQAMDFVYVTDIARANVLAAMSTLTDDVLNVASGTETSLTELAVALGRVMDVELPPEYGPARKATGVGALG
jgi:UDP-glucose 4-epimerase